MNTGGLQSNWFTFGKHTLSNGKVLPTATLKPEYREEALNHFQRALEQWNEPHARSELSDEQLQALKDKYGGDEMTSDEYQSFLGDLVEMGALREGDQYCAGGTIGAGDYHLTPVIPCTTVSVREVKTAATDGGVPLLPSFSFPKHAGKEDITEWARYRALFDTFYLDRSGNQQVSREKEIFQTISGILSKMEDR